MTNIMPILQPLQYLTNRSLIFPQLSHLQGLATTSCLLGEILERFFHKLDILDAQLLIDDGQVAHRVHITFHVDDLGIVKAPHNLKDGIYGSDVGKKGVSQTRSR